MKAIITGAASGIGRAVAFKLTNNAIEKNTTAELMLVDLNGEQLKVVAQELSALGASIETFAGDLTDSSVPAAVVSATEKAFGGLDTLISNAGIIERSSLLDLSEASYNRSFDINTKATWLLAKAAHPLLAASRGSIVATASLSGHAPTPPLGAYSASKAALIMLIQQMACEWGPDGIRCNTVSPGSTHTGMTDARYSDPAQRAEAVKKNPLHTVGSPEDQAAAIAFLASSEASYITGTDLLVDGGLHTMLMPASAMGDPWTK